LVVEAVDDVIVKLEALKRSGDVVNARKKPGLRRPFSPSFACTTLKL